MAAPPSGTAAGDAMDCADRRCPLRTAFANAPRCIPHRRVRSRQARRLSYDLRSAPTAPLRYSGPSRVSLLKMNVQDVAAATLFAFLIVLRAFTPTMPRAGLGGPASLADRALRDRLRRASGPDHRALRRTLGPLDLSLDSTDASLGPSHGCSRRCHRLLRKQRLAKVRPTAGSTLPIRRSGLRRGSGTVTPHRIPHRSLRCREKVHSRCSSVTSPEVPDTTSTAAELALMRSGAGPRPR